MDQHRLVELRQQVRWLALTASVLIVTYSTVGAAISGVSELKSTLTSQIGVLTRNVSNEYVLNAIIVIIIIIIIMLYIGAYH